MSTFNNPFYKTAAWCKCRDAYKKQVGGLCEDCLARGIYTPGEIVHHKIELTPENITDPSVSLNPDNLKLVCRLCHAKEHGSTRRYSIAPDGTVMIRSPRNF